MAVIRVPAHRSARPFASARLRAAAATNWPFVTVLVAFAATAFVVPTLAPVATTDDWGYSRSVEILYHEGKLTVFPVVAASAVFQVIWGWLFAVLFGMSLGVVRVATLVMVGLGGLGLFGLLRELGVSRGRSALGVACYLFNPLAFVLSYTFMTDPYFTALMILATYGYARGLRGDGRSDWATLGGSVAAAAALLTRQQGALIPLAVILFLLASHRVRCNRAGIAQGLRVAAIPAVALAGYLLWLRFLNDVPAVQSGFAEEARAAGLPGTWILVRHLVPIAIAYFGFFALPLAVALLPGLGQAVRRMRTRSWLLFSAWQALLIGGVAVAWAHGRRMPYLPQFAGAGGLGPPDVRGSRPRLFEAPFFDWATIVCAGAALVIGLVLCSALRRTAPRRAQAGLVLFVAVWQGLGVLPPSYHYLRRGYSLDRYLLPLLPLAVCLVLWAARDLPVVRPAAWAVVGVFAVFAVAGTRDYLVFLDASWRLAEATHAGGVARDRIDAGAAWDGYRLYTDGLDQGITRARTRDGPWWLTFYGKATDSTYVVSRTPLPGYSVIDQSSYDQWLWSDEVPVLLLQRISTVEPVTPWGRYRDVPTKRG